MQQKVHLDDKMKFFMVKMQYFPVRFLEVDGN